jgi:hypothetical protein
MAEPDGAEMSASPVLRTPVGRLARATVSFLL